MLFLGTGWKIRFPCFMYYTKYEKQNFFHIWCFVYGNTEYLQYSINSEELIFLIFHVLFCYKSFVFSAIIFHIMLLLSPFSWFIWKTTHYKAFAFNTLVLNVYLTKARKMKTPKGNNLREGIIKVLIDWTHSLCVSWRY